MMEKKIISKLKTECFFWKKLIIRFVNVETDPRLPWIKVICKVHLSGDQNTSPT
jgi:hypothetical protein